MQRTSTDILFLTSLVLFLCRSRSAADAFRTEVIGAKKTGVPVVFIDKCSWLYARHGDVYVVAVTKHNVNSALVFQFMYKMIDVFRAYFGGAFDEENCRQNFVLIYELLDEVSDWREGKEHEEAQTSSGRMYEAWLSSPICFIPMLLSVRRSQCCDYGYPQITAINILTSYIQVANVKAADGVR